GDILVARKFGNGGQPRLREIGDRKLRLRIADIENALIGNAVLVLENPHQRAHRVVDIEETALLRAAIDELNVAPAQNIAEKLRQHARGALIRGHDVVELRPDPVEGAEQRVAQKSLQPISVDHPVEKLLRAGIDPALLADRPENEIAR